MNRNLYHNVGEYLNDSLIYSSFAEGVEKYVSLPVNSSIFDIEWEKNGLTEDPLCGLSEENYFKKLDLVEITAEEAKKLLFITTSPLVNKGSKELHNIRELIDLFGIEDGILEREKTILTEVSNRTTE